MAGAVDDLDPDLARRHERVVGNLAVVPGPAVTEDDPGAGARRPVRSLELVVGDLRVAGPVERHDVLGVAADAFVVVDDHAVDAVELDEVAAMRSVPLVRTGDVAVARVLDRD